MAQVHFTIHLKRLAPSLRHNAYDLIYRKGLDIDSRDDGCRNWQSFDGQLLSIYAVSFSQP